MKRLLLNRGSKFVPLTVQPITAIGHTLQPRIAL